MSKLIPLSSGKSAIVDDSDYEWLSHWKWSHSEGYAVRNIYCGRKAIAHLRMHRIIIGAPDELQVDHINRNKLDNRRSNLRICVHRLNSINRGITKRNKTGFKGVSFEKRRSKFISQISVNGTKKHLGYFDNPTEASIAYQSAEKAELNRLC